MTDIHGGNPGRPLWDPLEASSEGPSLASVTARLRATPVELTAPWLVLDALLHDTLDLVDPRPLSRVLADLLVAPGPDESGALDGVAADPSHRAAAAVTCWLVAEPAFADALVAAAGPERPARRTAVEAVQRMAGYVEVVPFSDWQRPDEDRQEELARAVLRAAGLRPRGETVAQSEDRWSSISTPSRGAALREAARRQAWEEEVARALAEQKAREAAAQYTHV